MSAGKTRLATQAQRRCFDGYPDGAWRQPGADHFRALVPIAAARVFGPDQPGRSTAWTPQWRIGDRRMLVVLDNREHLLDGCKI